MSMASIFAKSSLLARLRAAALLCALAGLEWTTTSFTIRLFAFTFAFAIAAAAARMIHFFHDSIVIEGLLPPLKNAPEGAFWAQVEMLTPQNPYIIIASFVLLTGMKSF